MERKNQSWQDSLQKTQGQHSRAALMVRYKTVMLCILSLQTWRPWDLPRELHTQRKGLQPPQWAQTPQDTHTWTDTWRSCRWLAPRTVPGTSESSLGVRLLRHNSTKRVRRARQGRTHTPHTLSVQTAEKEAFKTAPACRLPSPAEFGFYRTLPCVCSALCTVNIYIETF